MERENLQYESVYFKELHNDRSTDNIQWGATIAAYCMERENLQYESVYFKELHNDRSTDNIQWGTTVVSTITSVYRKLLGCLLGISPSGRNPCVDEN